MKQEKKQQNKNPRWNDDLLNDGFTALPNALLDHQGELGITDSELLFILKVSRNSPEWRIHDKDFPGNQCSRTLQRVRRSLKRKGYLNFTVTKHINNTNNDKRYYTAGIVYNLSDLAHKLHEINRATNCAHKGQNLSHKRQNLSHEKHRMSAQPYTNTPYTNSPYTIIIHNNNGKTKIRLSEEQQIFLDEFNKIYKETYGKSFEPQMKDIKVLQKQNLKELLENTYLLPYWFSFKDDLFQQNDWLKKSDGSLPVFFKHDISHKFRKETIPKIWPQKHNDSTLKELFETHMKNRNIFKRMV